MLLESHRAFLNVPARTSDLFLNRFSEVARHTPSKQVWLLKLDGMMTKRSGNASEAHLATTRQPPASFFASMHDLKLL